MDNDFQNTFAYLDFKKINIVKDFVAFEGKGIRPDRITNSDGIGIYLNYKQVAFVKSKAEALRILERLIQECPQEGKKDFEQYKDVLLRSLK